MLLLEGETLHITHILLRFVILFSESCAKHLCFPSVFGNLIQLNPKLQRKTSLCQETQYLLEYVFYCQEKVTNQSF